MGQRELIIDGRTINDDTDAYVIAEIGHNHQGDLETCKDLFYEAKQCGADAVSILTDEKYFQGKLEYIDQVRHAVNLPILRKDFIIDIWQVYESRVAGADAILLIAEALKPAQLIDLLIAAYQFDDPFSFIMTFFASNLIILISATLLVGFVWRMVIVYKTFKNDKGEGPST